MLSVALNIEWVSTAFPVTAVFLVCCHVFSIPSFPHDTHPSPFPLPSIATPHPCFCCAFRPQASCPSYKTHPFPSPPSLLPLFPLPFPPRVLGTTFNQPSLTSFTFVSTRGYKPAQTPSLQPPTLHLYWGVRHRPLELKNMLICGSFPIAFIEVLVGLSWRDLQSN